MLFYFLIILSNRGNSKLHYYESTTKKSDEINHYKIIKETIMVYQALAKELKGFKELYALAHFKELTMVKLV